MPLPSTDTRKEIFEASDCLLLLFVIVVVFIET